MAETTLGRYTLAQPIREDALGTTYAATDTILHRDVWLRVFTVPSGAGAGEPERLKVLAELFDEQARVQARLIFPGVPAVLDAGEADGRRFVATERPDGRPLSEELDLGGPMALSRAIALARQLLLTLSAAHERGAWHGALAMDSVLVTPTGRATILWLCNPLPGPAPERTTAERDDLRGATRALWACIAGTSTELPSSAGDPRLAHVVPPRLRHALLAALAEDEPATIADLLAALNDPHILSPYGASDETAAAEPERGGLAARLSLGVGLALVLVGALLQSWEAAALGLIAITPSAFLGERTRGPIGIGLAAAACLTALWARGELGL